MLPGSLGHLILGVNMARQKVLICPYCGELQPAEDACRVCDGRFKRPARQERQNGMGPWFVRDRTAPFRPGLSYASIAQEIEAGRIDRYTILRGPTTKQFWTVAKRAPGIAHLVGYCHNCRETVNPKDHHCQSCDVAFGAYLDRNYLGLPEVQLMTDEAPETEYQRAQMSSSMISPTQSSPQVPGGSVSSFISDAELLGGPLSDIEADQLQPHLQHPVDEASKPGLTDPNAHLAQQSAAGNLFDSSESNIRLRGLQQQIRSQQRVVLILVALLLVVVVVVGSMGLIYGLPALREQAAPVITLPPDTAPVSSSGISLENPVVPAQEETAMPSTASPAIQAPITEMSDSDTTTDTELTDETPGASVIVEPAPEPVPSTVSSEPSENVLPEAWRTAYEEAQVHYRNARNSSLPIESRIASAQAAAKLLEQVPSDAEAIPTPIRNLMEDIAEEIERLKVEEFIGS